MATSTLSTLNGALLPRTMKEQVADLIKKEMLAGNLRPGERIIELHLARQLGLGSTSVREGLFELERQGFLVRVPHKGVSVVSFSRKDRRQIQRIRAELEGLAVELVTGAAGAGEVAALREALARMEAMALEADLSRFYEADLAFHRKLWQASGNPHLARLLEGLVAPLFAFYVIRTNRDGAGMLLAVRAHERIVDAIEGGDPPYARSAMKKLLSDYTEDEDRHLEEGIPGGAE